MRQSGCRPLLMQSELSGPTPPYTTSPVGENRRDHWDGPREAPRRDYPIDQTAARHPDLVKLALQRDSTGGLTGSLYADARGHAGTIDAIFLNSPCFDLNACWLCPGACGEIDIPPVDLGDAVGQRGEAFLALAPVVIGGPRVGQRLDHLNLHALRGIRLPTLSTKARRPADLQPVGRC